MSKKNRRDGHKAGAATKSKSGFVRVDAAVKEQLARVNDSDLAGESTKSKRAAPNDKYGLEDWPKLRKKLRLATETDWRYALPQFVQTFLDLLRHESHQRLPTKFVIGSCKIIAGKSSRRQRRELEKRVRVQLSDGSAFGVPDRPPKLSQRQEELLFESGVVMLRQHLAAMRARSEPQRAKEHWAQYETWKQNYEKALFGRLSKSPENRVAFDFLRNWHMAEINDRESKRLETVTLTLPLRIIYLAPVLAALSRRDAKFFKGLAEAIQMLADRIRNSKDPSIGSGDMYLDKWLLEYTVEIGLTAQHTIRELNERFVSKFRKIEDRDLRKRCRQLGVPYLPDVRGYQAVRYIRGKSGKKDR